MKKTIATILLAVLIVCSLTPPILAVLTKTTTVDVVDAWQRVKYATCVVGTAKDISNSYQTVLYVTIADANAQANDGLSTFIVQVSNQTNGYWSTLGTFSAGAAATGASTTNAGALTDANTVIDLADATTAHFDHNLASWFLLDGADTTKSEVFWTKSGVGTSVLTVADPPKNTHLTGCAVWTPVYQWVISIPSPCAFVRVSYLNADANSDYYATSRVSKVSAL
jgi:hypothetical protein